MGANTEFELHLMRLNASLLEENIQLHTQLDKVKFLSGIIFMVLLAVILL